MGFAVLQSDIKVPCLPQHYRVIDAGVIRPHNGPYYVRLAFLQNVVATLIEEFSPTVCALEKAFCGINSSTALKLGEVRGIVMGQLLARNVELAEITPATVKKHITGSGRASKEMVADCIKSLVGFHTSTLPLDATDAIAIALCHGLTRRYPTHVERHDKPQKDLSVSTLLPPC